MPYKIVLNISVNSLIMFKSTEDFKFTSVVCYNARIYICIRLLESTSMLASTLITLQAQITAHKQTAEYRAKCYYNRVITTYTCH